VPHSLIDAFNPIFYPQTLAVIGASADLTKFGNIILSAIQEIGYSGKIYPVNPEGGEINGLKVSNLCRKSRTGGFRHYHGPGLGTLQSLGRMPQQRSQGVEILTSGFKETGTPEGRQMEAEIARFSRRACGS